MEIGDTILEMFAHEYYANSPRCPFSSETVRLAPMDIAYLRTTDDGKAMLAALAVVIPAIAQECAKLAEEIAYEYLKEWRAGFKSDSHLEGKSDGADEVADAIRQRFKING
jgi:hypothetical protein